MLSKYFQREKPTAIVRPHPLNCSLTISPILCPLPCLVTGNGVEGVEKDRQHEALFPLSVVESHQHADYRGGRCRRSVPGEPCLSKMEFHRGLPHSLLYDNVLNLDGITWLFGVACPSFSSCNPNQLLLPYRQTESVPWRVQHRKGSLDCWAGERS